MTGDGVERGVALLERLAEEFPAELGVSVGRMFNGRGVKTGGRFFAFVTHEGRLAVKLPERAALQAVDDGTAERITMGARTMREWISLPPPSGGDPAAWRVALEAARAYVS